MVSTPTARTASPSAATRTFGPGVLGQRSGVGSPGGAQEPPFIDSSSIPRLTYSQ